VEWANLPTADARAERCRRTNEAMAEVDGRTKTVFSEWQEREFSGFTGMLDDLETDAAPERQLPG
jgi:hypothetical protein